MKVIKFKKLEKRKLEKNIFMFLVIFISLLFTIKSYSSPSDLFHMKKNKSSENVITKVKYDEITVNSIEDIYKEREGLYVFSDVNIDLRKISSEKRKDVFIKLLLPSIEVVEQEILNNRRIVKKLKVKNNLTMAEKVYAENLFKKYKTEYGNWKELESKMIVYPTSLILSQGAIESAWGTSRFFREANNAFGIWSTNPNESRIPAKGSRGTFTPHLKKYPTLKDTVEDITLIISRSPAYSHARKMIWEGKSSHEVAGGLVKYSEEGHVYVKKVRNTLSYNKFEKYDTKTREI